MTDITVRQDAAGWGFCPHSAQADNFLFNEFNTIGPRDLQAADIYNIIEHAQSRGFVVRSFGWPLRPFAPSAA